MQSERHNATSPSHNLRIAAENRTDLPSKHHAKPDTRRFAGIFPLEAPDAVSIDCGDTTQEERNDSDDLSRLEFAVTLDKSTQVASTASVDQISALSAAQQIIACYRAVHGSDHAPGCARMETRERGLPRIPDDQRSMYTLATAADTQSTMDLMWRPKPKVHMRRTDQRALMQAQSQAIAMMHGAGLKPMNKIQCRRRGCADILSDVEALKYHLHIHNIADSAARRNDNSASTAREPSLVECSVSNSKAVKRNHSRSKSSLGTRHKCSMTYSLPRPRKLSAGSLLPSLFSPRENTPEVRHVPSLTTVAKALTPDPTPNKSASLLPARNDETPSTHISTPSRGRRKRKQSLAVSAGAECTPSITMLLSPPSSPIMRDRLVLTQHAQLPMQVAFGPTTDSESDNHVPIPNGSVHPVSDQITGSRSPMRALSPTRAMSPIRNGIKRILSIGCPDNVTNE